MFSLTCHWKIDMDTVQSYLKLTELDTDLAYEVQLVDSVLQHFSDRLAMWRVIHVGTISILMTRLQLRNYASDTRNSNTRVGGELCCRCLWVSRSCRVKMAKLQIRTGSFLTVSVQQYSHCSIKTPTYTTQTATHSLSLTRSSVIYSCD